MNKYLEAERRLAELLVPERNWYIYEGYVCYTDKHLSTGAEFRVYAQKWTRDWSACGPLIVGHRLSVEVGTQSVDALGFGVEQTEYYHNHPDEDTAIRYAIVMVVIKELEMIALKANISASANPKVAI